MKIRKIHIIGGPGSGKTYYACLLAEKLKIKDYDLDGIYWDNSADTYGVRADEKKRDAALKKILKNKSWIIEGVYYEWVLESFKQADLIMVLRPGVLLRAWRIIARYIARKTGAAKAVKKETIKGLFRLLKWNISYDDINLEAALEVLERKGIKYNVFCNDREVKQHISGIK